MHEKAGRKHQVLECVATAATASVRKYTREIMLLVRDHKIVAHGSGTPGSRIRLAHQGRLSGRYTMFLEIPGVTTVTRAIKL